MFLFHCHEHFILLLIISNNFQILHGHNFQDSALTLDGYINLTNMVKMAVNNINLMQPTAAAQYLFDNYYRQLTVPLLINPAERGTRQRPTTGQGLITNRLDALEDRKAKHQAFFGKLSEKANYYWFDHPYWQRQPRNVLRLQNIVAIRVKPSNTNSLVT